MQIQKQPHENNPEIKVGELAGILNPARFAEQQGALVDVWTSISDTDGESTVYGKMEK